MIIDCLSKAMMLFILYNVIAILSFGIPESLTKTFYKYKAHHDSFKFMYYVFVALMCILLTPCWLKLSKTNFAQDVAIINSLILLFTGALPIILKSDEDNDKPLVEIIEKLISYCCSMFFIIWIVAATPYWWIVLLIAIIVTLISIITKSWNKCYTYWIEIIAFASTFIAILLKYIM